MYVKLPCVRSFTFSSAYVCMCENDDEHQCVLGGRYNNRRLLTACVRDGEMVLLACVVSDKYWDALEPALRGVVSSFRVLP
jgi:hypothetical protein